MKFTGIWLRVAGNVQNIKGDSPFHWRCFAQRQAPEIPLRTWRLVGGEASAENFVPGTAMGGDPLLKLHAWIDVFCDVEIIDDVAHIALRPVVG